MNAEPGPHCPPQRRPRSSPQAQIKSGQARALSLSSNSSASASWLPSSQSMVDFTAPSIFSLSSGLSLSATCVGWEGGRGQGRTGTRGQGGAGMGWWGRRASHLACALLLGLHAQLPSIKGTALAKCTLSSRTVLRMLYA